MGKGSFTKTWEYATLMVKNTRLMAIYDAGEKTNKNIISIILSLFNKCIQA